MQGVWTESEGGKPEAQVPASRQVMMLLCVARTADYQATKSGMMHTNTDTMTGSHSRIGVLHRLLEPALHQALQHLERWRTAGAGAAAVAALQPSQVVQGGDGRHSEVVHLQLHTDGPVGARPQHLLERAESCWVSGLCGVLGSSCVAGLRGADSTAVDRQKVLVPAQEPEYFSMQSRQLTQYTAGFASRRLLLQKKCRAFHSRRRAAGRL